MQEMTKVLDGTVAAEAIKTDLKQRTEILREKGIVPCLATVLVGDDPASVTYVRMKRNACKNLGITSRRVRHDSGIDTSALLASIEELNQDPSVHGILLQHPVSRHIDERAAFDAIAPNKDVDGVGSAGFGRAAFGLECFPSCTPEAIMRIMDYYKLPIAGKHAVVVGRSPILGKPVAMLLLNRDATVTICHSRTEELQRHLLQADIVVAAVGKSNFIQKDWIKPGAVILDAGYSDNKGDVDFAACLGRASAITPVPGGVGPVTIACLLEHTVQAAERLV